MKLVGYVEVTEIDGNKVWSDIFQLSDGTFSCRGILFHALPDVAFMYRGMKASFEHGYMQETWGIFSKP